MAESSPPKSTRSSGTDEINGKRFTEPPQVEFRDVH